MDEVVRRAMEKWPNVPAVFGWLALDLRGNWLLKSDRITNPLMIEFIQRNYAPDDSGRWFFQNGPQRVYVALAYAPLVLRAESHNLVTHVGRTVQEVRGAWMDESGVIVLSTEQGPGTVDDRDADLFSSRLVDAAGHPLSEDMLIESVERMLVGRESDLQLPYLGRTVRLRPIRSAEVPSRLGFVRDPQPSGGEASA